MRFYSMRHFSKKKLMTIGAFKKASSLPTRRTHTLDQTNRSTMPSALTLFPSDIPVAIRQDMPLCYLHQRAMWLRDVLDIYYNDTALDRLKDACPADPDKFVKIRRYRERQLSDTEARIAKLETASIYHTIACALF